jgi:hypothetical protein
MKEALVKTPLAIVLSVVAVGVIAANQLGAQTTVPPAVSTTTPAAVPTSAGIPTVQNIVEITRAVPAGTTAVDAFTVPAGVTLVVTDVIVTNTGTAAACGGAVNRGGAGVIATTPAATTAAGTPSSTTSTAPTLATAPAMTTTSTGTLTQTDSTLTGPLCVPPQTTTTLPLTTGIEFTSGQIVQLLNAPVSAAPLTAGAPGSLAFHLRGLLITLG